MGRRGGEGWDGYGRVREGGGMGERLAGMQRRKERRGGRGERDGR